MHLTGTMKLHIVKHSLHRVRFFDELYLGWFSVRMERCCSPMRCCGQLWTGSKHSLTTHGGGYVRNGASCFESRWNVKLEQARILSRSYTLTGAFSQQCAEKPQSKLRSGAAAENGMVSKSSISCMQKHSKVHVGNATETLKKEQIQC